jgi:hypothetical protein
MYFVKCCAYKLSFSNNEFVFEIIDKQITCFHETINLYYLWNNKREKKMILYILFFASKVVGKFQAILLVTSV